MEPKVRAKINEHIASLNTVIEPNPECFLDLYETTVWSHGEEYPFKSVTDGGYTVLFQNADGRWEVSKFDSEGNFKKHLSVEEIKRLELLDDESIGGLDESYHE